MEEIQRLEESLKTGIMPSEFAIPAANGDTEMTDNGDTQQGADGAPAAVNGGEQPGDMAVG